MTRRKAPAPGLPEGLTIFDSDASNPYSEELLAIFRTSGIDTMFAGPADNVLSDRTTSLRPRFRADGRWALLVELAGMMRLFLRTSARRPVVVVWARPYQKLILGCMAVAKRGSIVYIVHNPEASRWPKGARGTLERWFVKRIRPVVHSETLRGDLARIGPYDAAVVVHPPYVEWQKRMNAGHVRCDVERKGLRLLILGRMEPDKFRSLPKLVSALEKLPVASTLRVLVRPAVHTIPESSSLIIENRSRDGWIEDAELADGLRWADVLIAPYEAVTESGTVQLALTLGVRVVAFSGGALENSLISEALVDMGDYSGLAAAIVRVTSTTSGTSRWTPESRSEECLRSWLPLLSDRSRLRGTI